MTETHYERAARILRESPTRGDAARKLRMSESAARNLASRLRKRGYDVPEGKSGRPAIPPGPLAKGEA